MSVPSFDDLDSDRGFYVSVIRLVDRVRGVRRDWSARDDALGESLLSALCDDRFLEVHGQIADTLL